MVLMSVLLRLVAVRVKFSTTSSEFAKDQETSREPTPVPTAVTLMGATGQSENCFTVTDFSPYHWTGMYVQGCRNHYGPNGFGRSLE